MSAPLPTDNVPQEEDDDGAGNDDDISWEST